MKMIYLNHLKNAVESLTTCTSPSVQVGEIVAMGYRLNSPYASRREVIYKVEKKVDGVLSAWNDKYHVHVEGTPPSPYPLQGYVREWKELEVPTAIIQPLIRLATELGLSPKVPNTPLVTVYILNQIVASWNYSKPIFWLGGSNDAINKTLYLPEIPQEKIRYKQNELILIEKDDVLDILPDIEEYPIKSWGDSEWFFSHLLYSSVERTEYYVEEKVATPVAIYIHDKPHALIWGYSPCKIVSDTYEPLVIRESSTFLAIHPIEG